MVARGPQLPFLGILYHLLYLVVREEHNALGLGDTVNLDAIFIQSLKKGFHGARALNARHLKAVLTAIRKTLFRSGKIIKIASRHTNAL